MDKLYSALIIANGSLAMGMEASLYFTFWGLDIITKSKMDKLLATPGRLPISVIITTYNEEINIEDCIRSVLWADEIFLVDSYSTDRTMEIARQYPIVTRRREYFGSAAQKNWSIDRVKNDWVLVLDADERVTEDLAREILEILVQNGEPVEFGQPLYLIRPSGSGSE